MIHRAKSRISLLSQSLLETTGGLDLSNRCEHGDTGALRMTGRVIVL